MPGIRGVVPGTSGKDVCLKTLDEVARTKASIVITKRGKPVAKLVPCAAPAAGRGLAGP